MIKQIKAVKQFGLFDGRQLRNDRLFHRSKTLKTHESHHESLVCCIGALPHSRLYLNSLLNGTSVSHHATLPSLKVTCL